MFSWCTLLTLVFFSSLPFSSVQAQNHVLNGFVEDSATGERLAFATLYDLDQQKGGSANEFGFFSIKLSAGSYSFQVSYVGYQSSVLAVSVVEDTSVVIRLAAHTDSLGEISITDSRNPSLSSLNQHVLTPRQIEAVPVILGEPDVLKALQLLPGVQSGAEGSAGLYVRGGGPDQNMILLDGAPIYHAAHLFGFFSVFNTDALQSVRLIKGGFPARYGGRLSSVVDIDTREGNLYKPAVKGGVSLIASRITLEAPIRKEKSSFILSARRTYLDALFKPWLKDEGSDLGYFFYDVNAKINYIFSPKSRVYASFYNGKDRFFRNTEETFAAVVPAYTDYEGEGLSWRNTSATVRFSYRGGNNLFFSAVGLYSKYRLVSHREEGFFEAKVEDIAGLRYQSGITDLGLRVDIDYLPNPQHAIRTGFSLTNHTFSPGVGFSRAGSSGYTPLNEGNHVEANEGAVFIEDEIEISPWWRINAGIHASAFWVEGVFYNSIQPRLSTRLTIITGHELTASFTKMQQYIHLLAPSGLGMPTDLWLPSTSRITPESALQWTLGYAVEFGQYSLSTEGFIKEMDGLIEYQEGASFSGINRDWQDKVDQGKGVSKGVEVLLRKEQGRVQGLIGYTLAKTDRLFEELNRGESFPFRYDRRHDLSTLLTWKLTEKKSVSASWVYGTGDAITAPTSWYLGSSGTDFYSYYPSRGNYRAPAYHRLDFSYTIHYKLKRGESAVSFNIYNAYSRKNPFYLYTEPIDEFRVDSESQLPGIKQRSLFPIVPSVDYNFTF